jgi:hypothetical protein
MTQREKKMALGGLGLAVLVGGFLVVNKALLEPLQKNTKAINLLRNEIDDKLLEINLRTTDQREFNRLKGLSLPADPDPERPASYLAKGEYDKFLRDLLRKSKLQDVVIKETTAPVRKNLSLQEKNKKPLYTPLTFSVDARGELTSVVAMLDGLYQTPLLHEVKTVTVRPVKVAANTRNAKREVEVKLTVEALLLEGAEKRKGLLPGDRRLLAINALTALRRGPASLALLPLHLEPGLLKPPPLAAAGEPGQYAAIARKNIFHAPIVITPPPPPTGPYSDLNINEHVRLTGIIHSGTRWVATFYNVFDNDYIRVRADDRRVLWGKVQRMNRIYQNFAIWDSDKKRKTARAMVITDRDVYFAFDESYYCIHLGETLAEAFDNKSISDEKVKELGLPEDAPKD